MPRGEIFVGDIGTVYRVPCYDDDLNPPVNFDPSLATTKEIAFDMPGSPGLLTRAATAAQVTIDGSSVWCLTYTVIAADVVPYVSGSVGGFHQEDGPIRLQGYVVFSSAEKWHSSFISTDQQGRILKVSNNLT